MPRLPQVPASPIQTPTARKNAAADAVVAEAAVAKALQPRPDCLRRHSRNPAQLTRPHPLRHKLACPRRDFSLRALLQLRTRKLTSAFQLQ
jgi:hypothetical protein